MSSYLGLSSKWRFFANSGDCGFHWLCGPQISLNSGFRIPDSRGKHFLDSGVRISLQGTKEKRGVLNTVGLFDSLLSLS